jgi:hypothetical protein
MFRFARGLVLPLVVLAGQTTPATSQDAKPQPLRLAATAVNMSGVGRAGVQTLQIVIERWSTDEERKRLIDTLVEKGSDKLLDALDDIKPRAGFIKTNRSLGWDIQFARLHELPGGGRRIVFGTDRPINFYEVRNNARSADYEFMLCEIRLGADGKGEGKLASAAKVTYDKEQQRVEIENYGQQPVRLTQVIVEK